MNNKKVGFTLIELLVVIAILAILVMIAAPSYTRMMAKTNMRSVLNTWRSSFYLAQKEAIRLKHRVELCPSADGLTCATDKKDYSIGWIVYDTTGNKVIQDFPPLKKSGNLKMDLSLGTGATLKFLNNGRLPTNFAGASLTVENTKIKNLSMKITISRAGRISNSN